MTLVRLMMAGALLGPLAAAQAGSWADSFQMGDNLVGRAGYDAPGQPGSFFGDWELGSFAATLANDTGGVAQVAGATSVGRNRLAVDATAGFLPDHWATQVTGGSTWSERLTITGGQGVGRARYSTFFDFTYGLQAEAFGNLMGSSLFFTFDWGISQGSSLLASGTYSWLYVGGRFNEVTQSPACVDAQNGDALIPCAGGHTVGEFGYFDFVYGQALELGVTVHVTATGTASLNAMHTGGIDSIEVPFGAVVSYESGRTDNPLGAVAAPVPEPSTWALWLGGGLLLAARRARWTTLRTACFGIRARERPGALIPAAAETGSPPPP